MACCLGRMYWIVQILFYYYSIIILYYSYATVLEEDELFPLDEYWRHIFDIKNAAGNGKFRHIQNLIKTCLSINHGDADVEGSLSDNDFNNGANITE